MMKRWTSLACRVLVAAVSVTGVMVLPDGTAVAERAVVQCTNAHLTASYRPKDAGMSHVYGKIVLRNTSDRTCWVRGYGGLSYVGRGDGTQVGAAADRTPSRKPRVVLEPGERVRSAVSETSAAPYPEGKCRPTPVDGFRVYVPDERRSQFVPHRTTGCANAAVHLLAHRAFH